VTATPDTGSEIDLIAPHTAMELGMAIQPGEEVIELADGTFAMTSGYVHANISLDSSLKASLDSESKSANTDVEFHILKGLTHTVLIGQDTLEELKVFTENQQSLVSASVVHNNFELNRIRSHGAADKLGSWFKSIFRSQATHDSSEGTLDTSNLRRTNYSTLLTVYEVEQSGDVTMYDTEDQRENDRRERESDRIASLTPAAQQLARQTEAARRQQYDNRVIQDTRTSNVRAQEFDEQSTSSAHSVQPDFHSNTLARFGSPAGSISDESRSGTPPLSPTGTATSKSDQNPQDSVWRLSHLQTGHTTLHSMYTRGGLSCEHPGCPAPPFQTQYLLKYEIPPNVNLLD